RSRSRARHCVPGRSPPPSTPGSGWHPRSARARGSSSTSRSTATSPCRPSAASPRAASSTSGRSGGSPTSRSPPSRWRPRTPAGGVDGGARAEIYSLIRRLAASGAAVLMVSSEIEEVLGLADDVLVVAEGRVVHHGPADQIDEHGVLDLVMEGTHA